MSDINPNMRRLKRIPGDKGLTFTLETLQEQKKDNLLCNFCSWKGKVDKYPRCRKYAKLSKYEGQGLGIAVRTCGVYQPILKFKPPLGCYKGSFNTFRLGDTWYNRVSPGDICGLYDTKTKQLFGKAIVEEVHNGGLEEMCLDHAVHNHLFLNTDEDEAATRMLRAIERVYGYYLDHEKDPTCTVIYLRNCLPQK